jgi:hypothetical protein
LALRVSQRQRESLGFNFNEHPANSTDLPVEVGALSTFEISEKTPYPGRHMAFEYCAARLFGTRQVTVGKTSHDLAQDRDMVLRLGDAFGARNADASEVFTQTRERAFVQETSQIV